MPLPPPDDDREPLHTRRIQCQGFVRKDGLFDIEGHIVDTKSYCFPNEWRGTVHAGDPVHEMWLRLTIDEDMLIHRAQAATDAGPYEACSAITPNFERLAGIRIGPGWTRAVRKEVGGTQGCTHIVELLRPIATVCYQTVVGEKVRRARMKGEGESKAYSGRPGHLNTCHMYATDGPLVRKMWPEFYTGD